MSFPSYPSHKNSLVDWLGEVPEHWEVTRTKRVTTFATGWTPPTGDQASFVGDNLWANISDLGPRYICDTAKRISDEAVAASRVKVSPAGSLLFSFKLSIGQVSFAGCDMYTNEAIATFVASEKLDLGYAYYALPVFLLQNATENIYGAKLLNQALMRAASLILPPREEQLIIAAFLDRETGTLDALISEQQHLMELLKEKRQALISHAVTKGLNHDAPMKPSGIEWLGDVPAHWEVIGLTKHLSSVVDYRGRTPTKVEDGVFLLTARNIRNGRIDYGASEEFIAADEYDAVMSRGKPQVGDVVFTTEAPLGQVANLDRNDLALAQRIIKFRGEPGIVDNYFLKYWIMGSHCQANLEQLATGSTALGIKGSKVGQVRFCLPPHEEQRLIATFLDQETAKFDQLVAEAERAIALLQERRSALVFAAVTGKIDVRGFAGD